MLAFGNAVHTREHSQSTKKVLDPKRKLLAYYIDWFSNSVYLNPYFLSVLLGNGFSKQGEEGRQGRSGGGREKEEEEGNT